MFQSPSPSRSNSTRICLAARSLPWHACIRFRQQPPHGLGLVGIGQGQSHDRLDGLGEGILLDLCNFLQRFGLT